ncbi:MAG TPA: class I tRNA ligase family protein [Candidatus Paceibacterota bacterium]
MAEEVKKSNIALREEEILKFWEERQIFEKSLSQTQGKKEFVFYEGPPTANGKPGIHHLVARAFKDAIPRYKTMRGFHVRRKGGWDTHGLPVELQVEKELGLKSKKEIEQFGIGAFNKKCKESVWKYVDEWKRFTKRIGYWIDLEHPYVTYDPKYIESLWAIVKRVHERDLLYKDYKVVPWCPRCGTGLSSHELAQGYQDVKDLSLTVKFKVKSDDSDRHPRGNGDPVAEKKVKNEGETYLLAWTTTPWTLPGNAALAVGENVDYVKVKIWGLSPKSEQFEGTIHEGTEPVNTNLTVEILILAKSRIKDVLKDKKYEIISELKGGNLVGLEYEPLYPFLKDNVSGGEKEKLKDAFKVYAADFVTTTDGTGIVHTAVMYGADDFELGTKVGLPKHHLVNDDGTFKPEAGFLAGKFVKDESTDVEIIKDLALRGLLFDKKKYEHSYPHCWRCKTPLIYFARDSWYIKMSALRNELIKENEKISWEPEHVKQGRFGEWLKDLKDWAISRERYWGTPLPIWQCGSCKKIDVIGSYEELRSKIKKSGNTYFVMRHGEAENNVQNIISSEESNAHHLTEKGKKQVKESVALLKKENIELILASPFVRTRETAEIVRQELGLSVDALAIEQRIHEVNTGVFNCKPVEEYHAFFKAVIRDQYHATPSGGESHVDVRKRMGAFLYDVEKNYQGKRILFVTHDSPAWLLASVSQGLTVAESIAMRGEGKFYSNNAQVRQISFTPLPHDEDYGLDPHRPYIDEVSLACGCGGVMTRAKEVMDVWFDSGAMPFATHHYPFEPRKEFDPKGGLFKKVKGYPADFISEAVDQTRGWFYTLHAIGALMGVGKAYNNVICLGHILDKEGKKMSKSVGNIVEPWEQIEKYGVDALRFWMYSVNQPGDSKNYDEKTVDEIVKKVFNPLLNVEVFYSMYKDSVPHGEVDPYTSVHVLDQWILTLKDELVLEITEKLDAFNLFDPTRAIKDFIADLSQWYVRRSRDRYKGDDKKDAAMALATTRLVLLDLSKLMAPFTPFFVEDMYKKVGGTKESVHLEEWPENKLKVKSEKLKVLEEMAEVRKMVSLGLEARSKAGIKVRQPLQKLKVKNVKFKVMNGELIALVKDEVNVKEVVFDESLVNDVELDITLTAELKEEGYVRELLRAIQDLRKEAALNPGDKIILSVSTDASGKGFLDKYRTELQRVAGVENIKYAEEKGKELVIETYRFVVQIVKN